MSGNVPGLVPGAEDTYSSYGRAWANLSNTPFRHYKHWVHEGGIATPLIAHWPRGLTGQAGSLQGKPSSSSTSADADRGGRAQTYLRSR